MGNNSFQEENSSLSVRSHSKHIASFHHHPATSQKALRWWQRKSSNPAKNKLGYAKMDNSNARPHNELHLMTGS